MKLELLLAVVHNDKAAYYSSLIQSHQANLQLTVPAKGTSHLILNYLGLTEREELQGHRLHRPDDQRHRHARIWILIERQANRQGGSITWKNTNTN